MDETPDWSPTLLFRTLAMQLVTQGSLWGTSDQNGRTVAIHGNSTEMFLWQKDCFATLCFARSGSSIRQDGPSIEPCRWNALKYGPNILHPRTSKKPVILRILWHPCRWFWSLVMPGLITFIHFWGANLQVATCSWWRLAASRTLSPVVFLPGFGWEVRNVS